MVRFDLVKWFAAASCCLGTAVLVGAAEPAKDAKEAPLAPEAVAQLRVADLATKRQAISEQIDRASQDSSTGAAEKNDGLLSVLRSTDAVYVQQQAQLDQRRDLEGQVKKAEQDLEALDKFAPDEPKPYSFLLLETLQDQLDVAEDRQKALKADAKAAEQSLKTAHDDLDTAEKDRQTVAARNGAARNGAEKASDELVRAEAGVKLARAKVALRQNEIEVDNLRVALSKATQEQLKAKIKVVEKDAKFSAQDRDTQVARLEKSVAQMRQQRREAEMRLQQLETDKKTALDELLENKAPESVASAANEAWHVASDVYQGEVAVLNQAIENRGTIRRAWTRRYDLASDAADLKKLPQWLDDLDEFRDQLDDFASSVQHRRDSTGAQAPTAAPASKKTEDEGLGRWRDLRQAKIRELRDVCDARLEDIHVTQRMLDRFRSELKAKIKKTGSIWGTTAGQKLNSVLSYEIAGDEDTPVTIGRLLELLLYVAVGIAIAYALTHVIARRLLPRLGLHHGTVSAIKSIMFYALCVGSAVAAFQLLQIPAEAFAFVGGAVAIAIGFGGQDIMNNFMSGIILLVERPIRTGDVVQLGGVQGVVLHIGLRSTRLQTDANHELIVPNKTLIDEQVTNLTLSDNFVQRFVTATLERDVPIDEAKRKMLEVVFRHPLVLKSPRPIVLLKEVETYWLTFEIHFWLEHGSFIKCAMVESDILEIIGDIYRPPKEDVEGKEDNVAAKSEDRVGDAAAATAASAATGPAGSSQVLGDMKKMSRAVLAKELKRSMRIKA